MAGAPVKPSEVGALGRLMNAEGKGRAEVYLGLDLCLEAVYPGADQVHPPTSSTDLVRVGLTGLGFDRPGVSRTYGPGV